MVPEELKTWRCMVCGYVYIGEAPPASCPKCGAGYEEFEELGSSSSQNNTE